MKNFKSGNSKADDLAQIIDHGRDQRLTSDTGLPINDNQNSLKPGERRQGSRLAEGNAMGLSVLVVEDDSDTAASYAVLLETLGHRVRTAHDGATALLIAAEFVPDAALIDIGLPGIDGFAVARSLSKPLRDRRPFLVAITGRSEAEDIHQALKAGFDLHMTKPADPQKLAHLINRFHRVVATSEGNE